MANNKAVGFLVKLKEHMQPMQKTLVMEYWETKIIIDSEQLFPFYYILLRD